MTNERKGRGPGRSSIAPPARLRRTGAQPEPSRSLSVPPSARSVPPDRMTGREGIGPEQLNRRREVEPEEQFGGSSKEIEPRSSRSMPSEERPFDPQALSAAERWNEPGSRTLIEAVQRNMVSCEAEELPGQTEREIDPTAGFANEKSRASMRPEEGSTAANSLNRNSEAAASKGDQDRTTSNWESQFDSIPAASDSRRASYIIYLVLGVVLIGLMGLYYFGKPAERSKKSAAPLAKSDDGKSAPSSEQSEPRIDDRKAIEPLGQADENAEHTLELSGVVIDRERIAPKMKEGEIADESESETTASAEETELKPEESSTDPAVGFDRERCCSTIQEYQEALRLNPRDTEILGKLAYFYLNKGMNQEAKRFAQRTVDIDPKSSTGWIVLGAALDAVNDREAALKAYRICAEQAVGKYVAECRNLIR